MAGWVPFIARSQARRRWRALVALTLFVGLVGGLSLSLIAGSRRSASVVDRFFASARHYDFGFYAPGLSRADLRAIPGVVRVDPQTYVGMVATNPDGSSGDGINGFEVDYHAIDPTARILEGRVPETAEEVAVNPGFVEQFGLSAGDTVNVRMFGRGQEGDVRRGRYEANGPRYRFRITAVARTPADIGGDENHSPGRGARANANGMFLSHKFYETHHDEFLDFGGEAFAITLSNGVAGREEFLAAVNARLPDDSEPAATAPVDGPQRRVSLESPVQLETSALLALGLSLAAIGTIALALLLRAEQRIHHDDTPTMRTLGSTKIELGFAAVVRTLPVALGGMLLAIGVALVLSPRYPIGIGRELELQGGIDANLVVFGLGALAIVVITIGLSFLFGWPRRVRSRPPTSRLTLARWLTLAGAPTDLTLGTQLAFERGRGVRSVPARQAVVGGAAALALVTAVAIYVGGIDRLYEVPSAHGWPWDAAIGNTNFPLAKQTATELAHDPRIRHYTLARYGDAKVNGRYTEFLAFDPGGDAPPEVIAGRLPETDSEVALGREVLDALGVDIGSTVRFSVAGGEFERQDRRSTPRTMRVVGVALSPILGESNFGDVGIVTLDAVAAAGGKTGLQLVVVDTREDSSALTSIDRDYTEEIMTDSIPSRIVNLHRVRRVPLLGLLFAGFMGTILLVYTLTISARARARELAVLRSLGLPSKRLRRVLAWQGGALAAGIIVLGIPIGLVLGTAVWNAVADDLGVSDGTVITPLLLALAPLALLVGIVASLYPSRRARREHIADLLRVE